MKSIKSIRFRSQAVKPNRKTKFIPDELKQRHKQFYKPDIATKNASSNHGLLKNLLKSTGKNYNKTRGNYYDPANAKLNLSLNNAVLFDKIAKDTKDRTTKRFEIPGKTWRQRLQSATNIKIDASSLARIKKDIHSAITKATISADVVNDSINIGDLVTLHDDNVNLYLVVEIPQQLGSSSYTFVNNEGEVFYAQRSAIKLRFPSVIPKKYYPVVSTFVQLEQKYKDIAPIGVANDKLTRSIESLPEEMKDQKEPINDSKEGDSMGVSDDFLVAQASAQFLTNSNVNTYMVPIEARSIYSSALTEVSIRTFNQLSSVNAKLEVLHRQLQYDHSGDLINTPRTVSIFEILYRLENLDTTLKEPPAISRLGTPLSTPYDFESHQYHISTFLALIISLRKQARLWNIDRYNKSFPPTSVTVLPIQNVELIHKVVRHLKFKKGDVQFANYFSSVASGDSGASKPKYYHEIVRMFKDYIIGNFTSDPVLETLLVSIIRLIDTKMERPSSVYSYEYSKARAYDILNCLEKSTGLVNPSKWSNSLKIADDHSVMTRLSSEYFDLVDQQTSPELSSSLDDFTASDPLGSIREKFEAPVYCIDSASAHEIDDGISIHSNNDKYVISTHIADPGSYIKPFSTISAIAFGKARTTYLPEGPSMMLPKVMADISGLGVDGRETRTFVVQYKLDKALVDQYIANQDSVGEELMDAVQSQISSSVEIKAGLAANFPHGYTYDKVDSLLRDEAKITAFKQNRSSDIHFDNLYRLYSISTILNRIRIVQGQGTQFSMSRSSLTVSETGDVQEASSLKRIENGYEMALANTNQTISIVSDSAQSSDSRSQLLVSEFMIMANHCSATYARDNAIDIIFRSQEMALSDPVRTSINEIVATSVQNKRRISEEDLSKILSVLTGAKTHDKPKRHESLGVSCYTNVTSPLRRYTDILNHWSFHEHMLKKSTSPFKSRLQYIGNHLQTTELINNQIQRFSLKFWEGVFFVEYLKMLPHLKPEDQIKFRVLIKSNPKMGSFVSVDLLGFNNLRTKLEINPKLMKDFSEGNIKVGQVVDSPNIKISRVDFIEDELVLEYN